MTEPITITIHHQARVTVDKLNMREEPSTDAKVDGQMFKDAVVSVVNPKPEGPEELVQIVFTAYASRKYLEKINDG